MVDHFIEKSKCGRKKSIAEKIYGVSGVSQVFL